MLVLWVGLVAVLYAGGITLFYPVVLDNAAEYEQLMKVYPKELMAAFGIEGSLGDAGTFLNSYVFQFLWPLVAAIAAILLGTRIAVDAESGFLDLPLSTRLPRLRYLASAIAGQVVAIAAIAVATVGAIVIADLLIQPNFPTDRVILAGVHAFTLAAAIAGVTTFLAIAFLDRGKAGGLVAGILIVMYLVNVLAAISPGHGGSGPVLGVPVLQSQGPDRLRDVPDRRFAAVPVRRDHRLAAGPGRVPSARPRGLSQGRGCSIRTRWTQRLELALVHRPDPRRQPRSRSPPGS